jgi:hypothetical protein
MAERSSKLPPGVPEVFLEAFLELLEDWVQFCPALARLCGSAAAGLMLSKAFSWSRTEDVIARGGWFWKTAGEWTEETCLSLREQQTAREIIRRKGFWDEEKRKINGAPTIHFKVNFRAVIEAHIGEVKEKMEMAKTPNGNGENAKSIEMAETPNGIRQKRQMEFDKNAKSYKEANTQAFDTTVDTTLHRGGPKRPHSRRFNKAERDTWDLRRWQAAMKESQPQPGEHIDDPDEHWRERSRRAAFVAGLAPSRLVELLKQHFPNDPNIDLLYERSPLFERPA